MRYLRFDIGISYLVRQIINIEVFNVYRVNIIRIRYMSEMDTVLRIKSD